MISLWVLGTVFVSKLGIQFFPKYNDNKKTFILLIEILAQLLFIHTGGLFCGTRHFAGLI